MARFGIAAHRPNNPFRLRMIPRYLREFCSIDILFEESPCCKECGAEYLGASKYKRRENLYENLFQATRMTHSAKEVAQFDSRQKKPVALCDEFSCFPRYEFLSHKMNYETKYDRISLV